MPLNIDWQQILLHLLNFAILFAGLWLLLYKPVVGALRHARLVPESETHAAPVGGKKKLGFTIVALFLLASFILLGLVLAGVI